MCVYRCGSVHACVWGCIAGFQNDRLGVRRVCIVGVSGHVDVNVGVCVGICGV